MHKQITHKWTQFYAKKLAALKPEVIVWPSDEEWDDAVHIVSFDGVNFALNEPVHPTLHKDKQYFDCKGGKAGYTYEIALHLWENRIVWCNGPFPASFGKQKIFETQGLQHAILEGKKAIADKLFVSCDKVAHHNSLDTEEVRVFKRRACAQQERINKAFKDFNILKNCFCHGKDKHDMFVLAVVVVVTFQLKHSPLYDV